MTLNGDLVLRENVNAMNNIRQRARASSLRSFYSTNGSSSDDSDEEFQLLAALVDYPVNSSGKHQMPATRWNSDIVGKSFRRKVRRIANHERRKTVVNDLLADGDDEIELPRGAPVSTRVQPAAAIRKPQALDTLFQTKRKSVPQMSNPSVLEPTKSHFNEMRMKVFAARTAMDVQPALVERTQKFIESKNSILGPNQSPGVFSLNAAMKIATQQNEVPSPFRGGVDPDTRKKAMLELVQNSCRNQEIAHELLFTSKFDTKWKSRYTDYYMQLERDENGRKGRRPLNNQGWVLPLKHVCNKFGINPSFFTNRRGVQLQDARNQVLLLRLNSKDINNSWISTVAPAAVRNDILSEYVVNQLDTSALLKRLQTYKNFMVSDKDRVRVAGQYYNNIRIGKRMFGAARKQKFVSTIIGGMERRFEILDNQVNHIPFTHLASDQNRDKCRNPRVKCKDETRVVLGNQDNFIHANRVGAPLLFNEFIITQSPMDNTIDDFWRMVWQERCPYIVMLTSRKEADRCANYWPRHPSDTAIHVSGGIRVENFGVRQAADPLFRVTQLRLIGPDREERHVEHWQGDLNNSSNLISPLNILRLLRNTSRPVVIHDHLGISRAACLVAAEIAICNIMKGPTYTNPVQRAVQYLRNHRPYCIETPMQYIFVHRIVNYFYRDLMGSVKEVDADYERWLKNRSERMFLDDLENPIPGYRLLSPKVDPDLLCLVGRPERPNHRREAPDCVGEMPVRMARDASPVKRMPNILTPANRIFRFEDVEESPSGFLD